MKKLLTILILVFSFSAYCVTPISKGQVAPHSGYIFTKVEEKKVRKIREQKLKLEDLVILKDKAIDLRDRRIVILEKRVKNNRLGFWGKVGYFGLGILATSASIYSASKLLRR